MSAFVNKVIINKVDWSCFGSSFLFNKNDLKKIVSQIFVINKRWLSNWN